MHNSLCEEVDRPTRPRISEAEVCAIHRTLLNTNVESVIRAACVLSKPGEAATRLQR